MHVFKLVHVEVCTINLVQGRGVCFPFAHAEGMGQHFRRCTVYLLIFVKISPVVDNARMILSSPVFSTKWERGEGAGLLADLCDVVLCSICLCMCTVNSLEASSWRNSLRLAYFWRAWAALNGELAKFGLLLSGAWRELAQLKQSFSSCFLRIRVDGQDGYDVRQWISAASSAAVHMLWICGLRNAYG